MTTVADSSTVALEARPASAVPTRRRRVVGLVDTDSFAKSGAPLLATAAPHWDL